MQTLKRSFSFLDAEGKRARIDAEITTRNNYPKFTASGTYDNSAGQCLDHIKPATNAQKNLIRIWEKYHLTNIEGVMEACRPFDEYLLSVIDSIEEEEKEKESKKEELTGDDKILAIMEEEGIDRDMLDACKAYLENMGGEDLSDFNEAYQGEYSSDEEFAQDMAESIGAIDKNVKWPNNCIDWEQAARELMYDYFESNGYYFRNI